MYYDGVGVPQNYAEAAKWFRLAADQGDAEGQFKLGAMYYSAYGMLKDYITAHMWLSLSLARQKDEKLRDSILKLRDLVEKEMTPAQIAEAQRRVLQWQPKTATYRTTRPAPQEASKTYYVCRNGEDVSADMKCRDGSLPRTRL